MSGFRLSCKPSVNASNSSRISLLSPWTSALIDQSEPERYRQRPSPSSPNSDADRPSARFWRGSRHARLRSSRSQAAEQPALFRHPWSPSPPRRRSFRRCADHVDHESVGLLREVDLVDLGIEALVVRSESLGHLPDDRYLSLLLSASSGSTPPGIAIGRITYPNFLPAILRITRPTDCTNRPRYCAGS